MINNKVSDKYRDLFPLSSAKAREEPDHQHQRCFEQWFNRPPVVEWEENSHTAIKQKLELLAHPGGEWRGKGVTIVRNLNGLCYRLLNGPMAGLMIEAICLAQGLHIKLHPRNSIQSAALVRLLPRLRERVTYHGGQVKFEVIHGKG